VNWHQTHLYSRSIGGKIADFISSFIGSWRCVWLHTVWFLLWFDLALDINLLTLIVSLEAIFLCIFLLMSGNRQSERDRHQAEADYRTNVLAERNIEQLMGSLSRIEIEKLDKILAILVGKEMKARKRKKAVRKH
jgi:uncharacterized membrane protein